MELEKWAYVNLEGDEQVLVEKFAAMAAQTKLDNKDAIPSSICAHSLEPVVEPSRGLAKKIKHHLDTVLGRETQSLLDQLRSKESLGEDHSQAREPHHQEREETKTTPTS